MKFVNLHNHSHYSLLDGLSKIPDMMKRVQELEMEAVGLTDHGNMYGAVEFYKAAKKAGIKPIIGMETYVAHGTRHSRDHVEDRKRYHLTLLVKNETGYKNLIQLSTKAHLEGFYYKPRIDRELLEKHHEGLMCLSGCFSSELARLAKNNQFEEGKTLALWYKDLFGDDYYLEIQPHTPEFHDFIFGFHKKPVFLLSQHKTRTIYDVMTNQRTKFYSRFQPANNLIKKIGFLLRIMTDRFDQAKKWLNFLNTFLRQLRTR